MIVKVGNENDMNEGSPEVPERTTEVKVVASPSGSVKVGSENVPVVPSVTVIVVGQPAAKTGA